MVMYCVVFSNTDVVYGPFESREAAHTWVHSVLVDPSDDDYEVCELKAPR